MILCLRYASINTIFCLENYVDVGGHFTVALDCSMCTRRGLVHKIDRHLDDFMSRLRLRMSSRERRRQRSRQDGTSRHVEQVGQDGGRKL